MAMAEADADAVALCLEGSRSESESEAVAPRLERSRSRAEAELASAGKGKGKAEAPTCTWADYLEMMNLLESTNKKIDFLTWRLELARIQDIYGNLLVEKLFPQETWGTPSAWATATVLLLAQDDHRAVYHPYSSGRGVDSKRLRKEERSEGGVDKKPAQLRKGERSEGGVDTTPYHIMKIEEERSRLRLEYHLLRSRLRRPDFSGMIESDRAAEAERLREESLQRARLLLKSGDPDDCRLGRRLEAEARVLDFDPKQNGTYHNGFVSVSTFDLTEESPIGPMRFTNKVFQAGEEFEFFDAVNILSVNVACSDVGFPIHVYGTVIARDDIDNKRVYLFRRDRQHCQLINSKDEPLILTGPKRGLALLDDVYVETDLKIKDHQGQDRELSKGLFTISDIAGRSTNKSKKREVRIQSLATRLSTVTMAYAVVISAVEATVAIEVEEGEFYGIVTAHTTSMKKRLVLYDSQLADDHMPDHNGPGAIKMMRPVISVCVDDILVITVRARGGKAVRCKIRPRISREEEVEFSLGTAKMRLRHAWSIFGAVH